MILNSIYSFVGSFFYENRGVDVFVGMHPEYASILKGNQILISSLKKAGLLENSPESLQVLDAFLGRSGCFMQYYPPPKDQSLKVPLLHFAALGGQKVTIGLLVGSYGWNLREIDASGDSILHYAFRSKQKGMISWLEDTPGFEIARVVSKLFIIRWRNLAILQEEVGSDLVRLVTSVVSKAALLAIGENLDELHELFEDLFEFLSLDVAQMGKLKGELQNKQNATALENAFFKIIRVVHFSCLKNPTVQPLVLLEKMISLARNQYVQGELLGEGGFGQVLKVYNVIDARYYALKVANKQTEIRELIQEYENSILDYIRARNPVSSLALKVDWIQYNTHYALVMELHGQNLHYGLIEKMQLGASLSLTRKIGEQLIEALSFLEKVHLVHADVKPGNILLKLGSQDQVVLADFGASFRLPLQKQWKERFSAGGECQTSWYRSPECSLRTAKQGLDYGCGIDMWSLGCVLIDLFRSRTLFLLETDEELQHWHQMRLGPYPPSLLAKAGPSIKPLLSEEAGRRNPAALIREAFTEKQQKGKSSPGDAAELPKFIDLVQRMLTLDPVGRISNLAASRHGFFKKA